MSTLTIEKPPELVAYEMEILRRRLTQLREMAPSSLAAHARLIHRTPQGFPLKAFPVHEEMIRVLEAREEYPFVCFVFPPGYGKTSWAATYTSWRIGATGGKARFGVVCNTARQAYDLSKSIQYSIREPWFQKTYPGVQPDHERGWSQHAWYVTGCPPGSNPTVVAAGIGGPILGKRFDEILLDDPTTWEQARSDVMMAGQRHWLQTTLLTRFPPGHRPPHGKGGRAVVITTRWGVADLIPTLEDLGFKVIVMPALGYWDKRVFCAECEEERDPELTALLQRCEHCNSDRRPEFEYGEAPLWPEAESQEQLEAEREDNSLVFDLVKQGDPSVLSGKTFDAATFQRGVPPHDREFERVVQFVDTAGGKDKKKGDYFAEVTIGTLPGGDTWILDIDRGRYSAPDQERQVVLNHEKWSELRPVDLVCIEDVNEGTALFQRMVVNTRLPLKAVPPQGDKEFRAISIANLYRLRKVWHPAGVKWVRGYEAELEAFPDGAHDDQVDAAAGAVNESGTGPQVRVLG